MSVNVTTTPTIPVGPKIGTQVYSLRNDEPSRRHIRSTGSGPYLGARYFKISSKTPGEPVN
jgi:hypothetical protein